MLACYIQRYGNAAQIRLGPQPEPTPGTNEVVFRMHAASVNPIDFKTRAGVVKALLPYKMPLILGSDAAGEITALGAGMQGYQIGDRVAARLSKSRIGAFAESVCAHREQLAHIPNNVSFADAAAVALAGLTAWQCLTEVLKIKSGQRVLIHAGSGGVGHLAIQLAKSLGAHVSTTASKESHAWLTALGADQCVDYKTQDFAQVCAPFDAVLDSQGGSILLRSIAHTKAGGAVVSIGDAPTPEVATEFGRSMLKPIFWWLSRKPRRAAKAAGVHYRYWFMREDGLQLAMLLNNLSTGALSVKVAQEFPLSACAQALSVSEAGRVRGKIVVLG
jgi:NADPH:quinone reductase-like Zn-dependent oxidoreductase